MEYIKLNKSMCEEMFGGEMDVVEMPDDGKKSYAGQHRNLLYEMHGTEIGMLNNVERILK